MNSPLLYASDKGKSGIKAQTTSSSASKKSPGKKSAKAAGGISSTTKQALFSFHS
jgi:hypothetical protein